MSEKALQMAREWIDKLVAVEKKYGVIDLTLEYNSLAALLDAYADDKLEAACAEFDEVKSGGWLCCDNGFDEQEDILARIRSHKSHVETARTSEDK